MSAAGDAHGARLVARQRLIAEAIEKLGPAGFDALFYKDQFGAQTMLLLSQVKEAACLFREDRFTSGMAQMQAAFETVDAALFLLDVDEPF